MRKGVIQIYSGDGHGKSPAALGRAVQTACRGENVVIIQFLKGRGLTDSEFVKRLEPEIKIFRFEKSDEDYVNLSEERKTEEWQNIRNGLNFAKKVLYTGECSLLILDEGTSALDKKTAHEIEDSLLRDEEITLLTITHNPDPGLMERYDEIYYMENGRLEKQPETSYTG